MHYYQFNIGDYKAHTEHLDPMEDLAYRRMIDWCYLHEKPLPLNIKEIERVIRMRTHSESIAYVLETYFERTASGFVNSRIEKEVNKYQEKSLKAKRSAEARWNKVDKENNNLDDANALQTECEGNAKHKPLNTKHKPLTSSTKLSKDNLCPHKDIVDLYHEVLPELSKVKQWTPKRQGYLRTVWNGNESRQNLDYWRRFFSYVKKSDFLMGRANDFKANLEWLVKPSNFIKIIEKNYENK